MEKIHKTRLLLSSILIICLIAISVRLTHRSASSAGHVSDYMGMADSITKIVDDYPGEIGVAVIINNTDTITVNNENIYPMMSVFKTHQALAVCDDLDNKGISLDSLMTIQRDELDANTWSPMLKEHHENVISLPVRDLLRYALSQSDNNASNFMFKKLVDVAATDCFIATIIPRSSFKIAYKAYANSTSPLGAAILMNRLFTDSLISHEKQSFITGTLKECVTGVDRISAPLLDKDGVTIGHKTGSGYTNEHGVLAAHNDVAYISLPDNTCYALAIFVKNFKGNESEAAKAIARISATVYSLLEQSRNNQ